MDQSNLQKQPWPRDVARGSGSLTQQAGNNRKRGRRRRPLSSRADIGTRAVAKHPEIRLPKLLRFRRSDRRLRLEATAIVRAERRGDRLVGTTRTTRTAGSITRRWGRTRHHRHRRPSDRGHGVRTATGSRLPRGPDCRRARAAAVATVVVAAVETAVVDVVERSVLDHVGDRDVVAVPFARRRGRRAAEVSRERARASKKTRRWARGRIASHTEPPRRRSS